MDKVQTPRECWVCFSSENNRTELPERWEKVLKNCQSFLDISITIKAFENDIPWSCCNYCYDSAHQLTLLEDQIEKLQKEISDLSLLFSKNVVERRKQFRTESWNKSTDNYENPDPLSSLCVGEIIVKEEIMESATNALDDQQLTTTFSTHNLISCLQTPSIQLEGVPNCGSSPGFVIDQDSTAANTQLEFEASDEYVKIENDYNVNENYPEEVFSSESVVELSNSQGDVPKPVFVFEQISSADKTLKCEKDALNEDLEEPNDCQVGVQKPNTTDGSPDNDKMQKKKLSSFPCSVCGKSLPTRAKLIIHERTHTGEKPFACSKCTQSFRCAGNLRRHELIHSGKKPHKCPLCEKSFKCPEQMRRHQKIHSGKKPHKCSVCEKSFTRFSYLKDHKKSHTGDLPFKCSFCEKAFAKSDYLKRHEIIHSVDLQFKCSWCDKSFTIINYLKDHEKYHTGERPFKCSGCEKSFVRLDYLRNHEKNHSGDLPFKCSSCEKSFLRLDYLKNHEKYHSGDLPFQCSSCDKSFANSTNLKTHELLHTGVRPYKCSQCDKSYTLNNNLKQHVRLYHSPMPVFFNCSHCSKSFKGKADLKRHELIHSGEKPYKCPKCEKYFTRKQDVGYHYRRLHKETKEEFILP